MKNMTKAQLEAQVKRTDEAFLVMTYLAIGLTIFSGILMVSLGNMDSKFNEQKRKLNSYEAKLDYYFGEKAKARAAEELRFDCAKLEQISNKPFRIVTEFISAKPACNYGSVFLYSTKEIEDAILHYELGEKGK